MPVITGALGTITKGLVKEQEGLKIGCRAGTIQTTILLRSTIILGRIL